MSLIRKSWTDGLGVAAVALAAASPVAFAPTDSAEARPRPVVADVAPGSTVADFYRARGGTSLWLAPRAGDAAERLLQLLRTASADGVNPRRYNVNGIARAVQAARFNPAAANQAETMLSDAFVAYARDTRRDPQVNIIYVDPELRPTPPSPRALLEQAAAAPSLADYVSDLGWMSPVYGQLRTALANRMYRSELERRLISLNLERARALPGGRGRYVVVNPAAQRLYMYENGQVVDHMRVVAGRPDPIAQTPMMAAFIRFAVVNPYWNAPPDIAARKLAPNVLKRGRAYLNEKGYDIVDQFGERAHVLNPMSVDWNGVVAGRVQVHMRQKPGPANSMGRMKFMFPNEQGIWLHDTPEREKIEEAARLQSNGCVRLEDAPRLARWLFGRSLQAKGARPEQKVTLPQPVPIYITYLTAVPSGSSITYFDDLYGIDRTKLGTGRRVFRI